jgi:hypothetical protein
LYKLQSSQASTPGTEMSSFPDATAVFLVAFFGSAAYEIVLFSVASFF